jgi:hypothetical protein
MQINDSLAHHATTLGLVVKFAAQRFRSGLGRHSQPSKQYHGAPNIQDFCCWLSINIRRRVDELTGLSRLAFSIRYKRSALDNAHLEKRSARTQ